MEGSRGRTCYTCGSDLVEARKNFDFRKERGFSEKDAAAFSLHNPGVRSVHKQCCSVGLQTNIDPEADRLKREAMKEEIEALAARVRQEKGEAPRVREEVELTVAKADFNILGTILLRDGKIDNLSLLLPQASVSKRGYEVTHIAPLPETTVASFGWGKRDVLTLWSGNMKLVPVVNEETGYSPASFFLLIPDGDLTTIKLVDSVDKSLFGAEIIGLYESTKMFPRIQPTTGNKINVEATVSVIRLRKRFPEDIYA